MTTSRVVFETGVRERLLSAIAERFPRKSFGYLLSDHHSHPVADFIVFEDNLRNEPAWKDRFEELGQYFVDHDDAGFVASPEEAWRAQKHIWAQGLCEVGVFHSHRRHPGNFSRIDRDLHLQRFAALWHLIVSMRNPYLPQLRAFAVAPHEVRELPVVDITGLSGA
jgi:proteasome lid subunit RPN8/RPN11